jgi:hypothetical protein
MMKLYRTKILESDGLGAKILSPLYTNPWIDMMKSYMTKILESDVLGAKILYATRAHNTVATYGNTIRGYFDFCDEHWLTPLDATLAHMARCVAWPGQLGTIKASSLQPYMFAVNGFFKDHGLEGSALGDLVAKVRKGLTASEVAIHDTPVRVPMPYSIIVQALRTAQALRLLLSESTTRAALTTSPSRDHLRLLRACTSVAVMHLFFNGGGSGIDCITEDLVASNTDGIRLHHLTLKGERGVSSKRKLLCH